MRIRSLIAAALWFGLGIAAPASAQVWPTQPVNIVVPYPPGGDTDILARKLAEKLSQTWKQPVVVENKPGTAEIVGTMHVVNAKPDGYTLLMASQVALETNPFLFSKLAYDPVTDLTPITRMTEGPFLYVVRKESQFQTIQELVASAKENPEKVSYGSGGMGGIAHLAVNWFAKSAGNVEFMHVPYKGGAQRLQDLLAGRVDFTLVPLGVASGLIQSDKIRPLATSGARRLSALPDVPTFKDAGIDDAVVTFMFALAGPAKMPEDISDKIARDVAAVLKDPEFREKNIDPLGYAVIGDTPAGFREFLAVDRRKQKALVEAANVKLD